MKIIKILSIVIIGITIFFVSAATLAADDCDIPKDLASTRPDPAGTPTVVSIGIYVIDLMEINDAAQSYTADIYAAVSWRDPRLSTAALGKSLDNCQIVITDIWDPKIDITNRRKLEKSYPDVFRVDTDGTVLFQQRVLGKFSSHFQIEDFPFDEQELKISIISFQYGPDEVTLSMDKGSSGRLEQFSIPGWTIEVAEPRITTEYLVAQDTELVRFDFVLSAVRDPRFYLLKVLLPLTLIVFMAWTVFWIDPNEIGPQIGISTASVLTLIAFQFSFGYLLPRVSYLTISDKFLFASTLFVFLALAEAILTSKLAKAGKYKLALTIDHWARVIFPVSFFALVAYALLL
jgi:hypothetical protein